MKRARWLLLAILVLVALVGSLLLAAGWLSKYKIVDSGQLSQEDGPGAALEPGRPVGQTFVARHGGLAGIEFYLLPTANSQLALTLHLRADPQSAHDLTTVTVELPPQASPGFYRFAFPALNPSHGLYYYAFLDAAAPGVSMALADGTAYLDGAAYQDHQPLEAQTVFRLVYAPDGAVLDLLKAAPGWAGLLLVAGLLFVVPGWALLAWFWPGRSLTWVEVLGLAPGISLALYPLLLLWTDMVGLHLGRLYAWLPATAGLVALAWRYRTWRPRKGWETLQRWSRSEALWPDLVLLVLLAMVLGVRLLVMRSLDAPMWGDSYHHTMIAQLLVDNGGLFDSWAPYAELERFTYHFGFHSAVMALYGLTGLPVVKATPWTGQLLNAMAVVAVYPLAVRVTGSRWGGVWAVLLAGLLSPMPMFYTNWGRYTQLAGLVILPAAVWLTWQAVDMPRRHGPFLVVVALMGGGLALTHYRVFLFYGAFVLALALVSLRKGTWREVLLRLGWVCVGAGLLFLPWAAHTMSGTLQRIFWAYLTTPLAKTHSFTQEYNTIGNLETYLDPAWWLVMVIGIGVGLWQRQRGVLLAALWWLLLLIATNPAWLSLPGTGVITNFALFITAYLPAGLFTGYLAAYLVRLGHRRWAVAIAALLIVGLGIWGARQRMGDLDLTARALVTRPDMRAASWIQENTPPGARFLINSLFAYGGTSVVGTDGGWWLPLLAGRQTTVPPLLYVNELALDSDDRQRIHDLARLVQEHELDDPVVLDQLRHEGVTHVYVGQRQGRVNYSGENVIHPEGLAESDSFDVVYHQDRVWIFELNP